MPQKRVLLTGATGFIGRQCLPALLSEGCEVHAVSRSLPAEPTVPSPIWHAADLRDYHAIATLLEQVRPTHLLHLAWFTKHIEMYTHHENIHWVGDSLNLFHSFIRSGGRRMVVAGSCAEYDWSTGVCDETTTPMNPASLYGSCKHAAHLCLAALARQNNISYAWARMFYIYGPFDTNPRIVPSVIRSILAGEVAKCSPGDQAADFLHVRDVASALVALLKSDVRGAINIATGRATTIRDIAVRISELMGRPDLLKLGALPPRANDPLKIEGTARRLKEELGWQPALTLDEGLADTIEWWRRQPH